MDPNHYKQPDFSGIYDELYIAQLDCDNCQAVMTVYRVQMFGRWRCGYCGAQFDSKYRDLQEGGTE